MKVNKKMKVNKVKRAIIAAFAAVFAFVAPAVAADIVLPNGIDTSSYQDNNTVYDGTTYYSTLQKAVEGVCGNDGAILYCKPGADVGSLQHAPVTATLTIYGNGASVSGGSERDFDIGNTDPNGGRDITADMTLTVKDLEGCGAWGNKATVHTVNLVFEDCQNMGKVFITGTTGTLNITIKDSSFEGVIKEAVYSNADGTITLNNVDFSNLTKAVNLNHKAVGTQTVTITDCTFTNCGSDVSKDEIPVRVLSSVDGGKSVLTVFGTTFTGTPEGGADILLPESVGVTEVAISTTAASVSHKGEMISVKEDESYSNQAPAVAKIGDVEFTNFADALAAAKAMTGSVTVEIYEKVTLCDSLYGNYNSITFVGKDTDAEIYLDVQGYTTATGKTVNFNDLKLSKSVGGYIANAGFMNLAFGVYDVDTVNYTKCTFLNGAYASSGAVTFSNCTFYRSHDRYGLWAYGAQNIVVDGCTFSDIRGIKMYDEGKFGTTSITVKNTSFTAVTDKPAIVLTYGNSVTLEKNTYGAKGTFELDLDGKPNGVTVTSDVPPTCVNDNGACGVLVDGKIYTTVAQAAEVATANSTVTLLHNSAETVELPEGVTLNRNGFTADGVTVKQPAPAYGKVAKIGDNYYATLADALTAAKEAGLTDVVITLIGDTVKTTTDSFNLPYTTIFDNVTFKQADATKTYYLYDLYTGVRTNGGKFIFDGVNIVVTDQYMFEGDVELINNSTITSKADANCFVYYANVTIEPGSKLNGVIDDIRGGTLTVDGGKTDGTVNSTPDLQDAFLHVNWADSKLVVKNGAYAKINSVNEIGKLTVNGTVEVLNAKLEVLQEIAISQNASMKVDAGSEINAGKITGAGKIIVDAAGMSVGDEISLTANLANFTGMLETVGNDDLEACIVDGKIVLSAKPVAKIGETPYATLADALAAAQTGDTVELLSNVVVGSYETNKFENVNFTAINGAEMTIEANGEVQFIGSNLTNVKIIGVGTTRFYNTVNFYGANNVLSAINGTPFDLIVNKQSTLLISRFVVGYNRNITVYGDIEDASALKAGDIVGMTPSLKFNSTSGVSVGGTDVGNLIVKDAYIELGNSSWKNAYGTYDWNFTNSYVSATSLFNAAAGGTSAAKWNVTFDDCVLSAKNYIKNGVGVTINFYNGSVATTGSMRIDGELNIDKTSSVSTTSQQNNVVGKVDEHGGINGTVNVEGVLTIGSNARTQLEVLGGKINIKGGTLNLGNNTLTLDGASEMTSSGDVTGAIVVADGALVSLTGGTYTQDVKDWCAEGYLCAEQNSDPVTYKVGKLPSAEVVNLGPVEVGPDGDYTFGDNYYVYDLVGTQKMTTSSEPFDLQIALDFIAKDTVAQASNNAFGNYTTDFYITIDGIANGEFVADEDCYLAGYYPSFKAWVKIPLTGFKIEDGKVYPVITSAGFDFKYTDICGSVGDFICGIHLSDAVLQANPALKVKLELGLSKTYDDALAADKFVGVDQPYEYDVEDMTSAVAVTGPDYYTTVESAIEVALETGDFVKLVKDSKLEENLTLAKNLDFNLGGNTLSANGKSLAIGNTYVAITNGTLAGFTSANITLTGNAVLTVTDKNVADSFRTSVGHYVSQNANGTYSIMLKSAFRVFITMVDGEPRIGFFKDFAMGSAELKLVAATNLEKPDWQAVAYVEADDAAGASTLPLYWVKLNQAADDANVYRFFKLAE